jgi:hypothetical protein
MDIYVVSPELDDYPSLWYRDEDEELFLPFALGEPIAAGWRAPQLISAGPCRKRKNRGVTPDFPPMRGYLIVASSRALEVVLPLIAADVEVVPVIHPNGEVFHAINVLSVLACLDLAKSQTNADATGFITNIYVHHFKEEVVDDHVLFKITQDPSYIYASPAFVQAVESRHLTGLGFRLVYSSAGGAIDLRGPPGAVAPEHP